LLQAADPKLEALERLGLATGAYLARREALGRTASEASAVLESDPLGAGGSAGEALVGARELVAKLEATATLAGRLSGEILTGTEALQARVAELRKDSDLRLREAVFDPDVWIAETRALALAASGQLEAGELEAGRRLVEEASARLAGATERVDATRAARDENPARIAAAKRRSLELRGLLDSRRRQLGDLLKGESGSSLGPVADDLRDAAGVLTQVDRLLSGAEGDSAATAQRYLVASDALGRAENGLDAVAALFDEIDRLKSASGVPGAEARPAARPSPGQLARSALSSAAGRSWSTAPTAKT
jgi:hypothetical protein